MVVNWIPWIGGAALLLAAIGRDAFLWNFTVAMNAGGAFLVACANIQAGLDWVTWNVVAILAAIIAGIYYRRITPKTKSADTLWNLLKNDPRMVKWK